MTEQQRNIFKEATRQGLLFSGVKGLLTVDKVWKLSLQELDTLAVELHTAVQQGQPVSFINRASKNTELADNELRFAIVQEIITDRLAEENAKKQAKDLAAQRAQLRQILANKKLEAVQNLSIEDLENQLAALEEQRY